MKFQGQLDTQYVTPVTTKWGTDVTFYKSRGPNW